LILKTGVIFITLKGPKSNKAK
jgi:hypothetical protein